MTRIWGKETLFTTIPRAVRDQLALRPESEVAWRLEGQFAELRKAAAKDGGYVVYKQSRSESLYTTIPVAIATQLRLDDRSKAEWELVGDVARLRRA